ncbi:hypothetical protein L1987_44861 [Smallanthus sonchifolius]|uniref:Uncharacterized protein n=1 Tax=Smallanthus sonchifolius TaxID=185202 RepID=A0ACB9GRA1_9ASTR|nr:hypothetical protein L1987_44861 [Smallanthus sonchifolius]
MASQNADESDLPTSIDELLLLLGMSNKCAASDVFNFNELALAISKAHDNESLLTYLYSMEDDMDMDIEADDFESLLAFLASMDNDKCASDDFSFDAIMEHIFNCSKHHNRTKDETVMMVPKESSSWYKIPMRSAVGETIQLQTDTLTFVRAIMCFPNIASLLLYKAFELAKNGAKSDLASDQLPRALMNPGDKRSLKEIASSQMNFSKVIVEKLPYSDEFRVGILSAVGLTDPVVFKTIVDVCNNLCKVVGEPELTLEAAEKYHIKNNMICFFEDDSKDVASREETKDLADKVKVV